MVETFHFPRKTAVGGFVLGLAGCTVGPNFAPPAPPQNPGYTQGGVPALANPGAGAPQQHLVLGEDVPAQWWTLFHSPHLEAVLTAAIANNQTLAAARATLAQARETVASARGGLYPQVDFDVAAARERTSLLSEGINQLGPIANDFAIGPSVSFALDLFGGTKRRIEQQEALAEFQSYQLDGAYLALTGNAVRQAITIASTRAQIATLNSLLDDDARTIDVVDRQFALHYRTRVDVESARSQLAGDRVLLPGLAQQLAVARDALAVLTAKSPGDSGTIDFELDDFALPETLPVSIPSALVRQRPDLLAAEAQLHAASAAIGVATAQLYPNLTLTASWTQESLALSTLFGEGAEGWLVGSAIVAPLFHGGALKAQERGAIDAFDAAYASYRQAVLQSFGQVADVLQALDHDAQLLSAERQAVAASEAALEAARASYAEGQVQIVQVLDAQRQLGRARLGYTDALARRYLDTADLFGAMGGSWRDSQTDTAQKDVPTARP